MIAMDFGADNKLRFHGPDGPMEFPPGRGGSLADKFERQLTAALAVDDVVTESPTPGSSGAEKRQVAQIVVDSPHTLWTISARAVKNHIRYTGEDKPSDARAAEIQYEIAQNPERLKRFPAEDILSGKYKPLKRQYTSVRPYDKRGYKGPEVDYWLSAVPAPEDLPEYLQAYFVKGKRKLQFERGRLLPFAMAMYEPSVTSRDSYEKVLGLNEGGFPSFYRRATISLMQKVAKTNTGKTRMTDITRAEVKAAWIEARGLIRGLYGAMSNKARTGTGNPSGH